MRSRGLGRAGDRPCKGKPCRRQHAHCPICGWRLFGDQTPEKHDESCRHASRILPRLYLGGLVNATCAEELAARRISFALCMAAGLPRHPDALLEHRIVPLHDEDDEWALAELARGIRLLIPYCGEGDGTALLYCHMGRSRSVLVAVGLLMLARGLSLETAMAGVKEARSIAHPNKGYVAQLHAFESLIAALSPATHYHPVTHGIVLDVVQLVGDYVK
jgi:hypothetical protein